MDLKDITNKDELKKRTSNLFNDFDKMLQSMADDDISYKKAALIYYWLRDYRNYLRNECAFSANFLPSKR